MTKKLKRKVKRIAATLTATVAGICAVIILTTDVFVMPINSEDSITTKTSEATVAETLDGVSEITTSESEIKALATVTNNGIATFAEGDIIECESIVQGARDNNLPDGDYKFRVTGKNSEGQAEILDYDVEIINYYDNVHYALDAGQTSKAVSLGDNTTEYKMLIVKYHKNLTIDSGVTVTATNVSSLTYKKGMYLCVMGELTNNGVISMTARGTYNQAGENVYLWKNTDSSYEYVPAVRRSRRSKSSEDMAVD